jgi:MYXO-CTERM domain-containing protein
MAGDCDDTDPAIHVGAVDVADNFIDEDCSGSDNYDVDRDGDASATSGGTDCDDRDSTVAPSKDEQCDGRDNNCDGAVDEGCDGAEPVEDATCGCSATGGGGADALFTSLVLGVLIGRRRRASTESSGLGAEKY